jgi:hypothetical protein
MTGETEGCDASAQTVSNAFAAASAVLASSSCPTMKPRVGCTNAGFCLNRALIEP